MYLCRSDEDIAVSDDSLLVDVVDDIGFMMRTQARLYGAKCIHRMLPEFKGNYIRVPDFCPDPQLMKFQKSASTPLLAPIILRMILIILLFIDLLCQNKDGAIEEVRRLIIYFFLSLSIQ